MEEKQSQFEWKTSLLILLALACALLLAHTIYPKQTESQPTPSAPADNIVTDHIDPPTSDDLIAEYQASNYRVVAVVEQPFGEWAGYEHVYTVAPRGINDYSCGGMYTAGPCYFFLEASYYEGPIAKYITTWEGDFVSLNTKSLQFVDENTLHFSAAAGDAGISVAEEWSLDIRTGKATKLSEQEIYAD